MYGLYAHALAGVLAGISGIGLIVGGIEDTAAEPTPLLPLFASEDPLELVIIGPLNATLRDRSVEPDYREGIVRLTDDSARDRELNVKLRTRGRSRRDPKVCTFPPLWVNFAKKELAGTVFAGQDKLKLVTHCRDRNPRNEQYVLQEYLLYRVLNFLTENSFRVRLATIEYIDTDGKRRPVRAPGFLIEHESELARRRGLEVADVQRIKTDELDPDALTLLGLFQLLIGNTDWEVLGGPAGEPCCHNVVPFVDREGRYIPVPYDFDSTGVIDPPYAAPHESLKIKNVRDRLYRGFCHSEDQWQAAVAHFKERRDAIHGLFRGRPGLDEKVSRRSLEYLDEFYAIIDDPRKFDRQVVRACR